MREGKNLLSFRKTILAASKIVFFLSLFPFFASGQNQGGGSATLKYYSNAGKMKDNTICEDEGNKGRWSGQELTDESAGCGSANLKGRNCSIKIADDGPANIKGKIFKCDDRAPRGVIDIHIPGGNFQDKADCQQKLKSQPGSNRPVKYTWVGTGCRGDISSEKAPKKKKLKKRFRRGS